MYDADGKCLRMRVTFVQQRLRLDAAHMVFLPVAVTLIVFLLGRAIGLRRSIQAKAS